MWASLSQLAKAHPLALAAALGIFAFFVFSNVVQALPVPKEGASGGYLFFFKFMHGLAGNLKYAVKVVAPNYIPPDQQDKG